MNTLTDKEPFNDMLDGLELEKVLFSGKKLKVGLQSDGSYVGWDDKHKVLWRMKQPPQAVSVDEIDICGST